MPCNDCAIRKFYARVFDMHFSKEDCPFDKCLEEESISAEEAEKKCEETKK